MNDDSTENPECIEIDNQEDQKNTVSCVVSGKQCEFDDDEESCLFQLFYEKLNKYFGDVVLNQSQK